MFTYQFSNGKQATFASSPTSDDLKYVAQKVGATSTDATLVPDTQGKTTDIPKPLTSVDQPTGGVAGILASLTGSEPLGRGIGTAIANIGGNGNVALQSQDQANATVGNLVRELHNTATTPEVKQHILDFFRTRAPSTVPQDVLDATTQGLTNKAVIGSALSTGLGAAAPGITDLGAGAALGEAASNVPLIGGALKAVSPALAKTAVGAATGYGFDVGANLQKPNHDIFAPGFGTAVGAILPFGSALIGALGKRVVGATTGAGTDVIQQAIDHPTAVRDAISTYASTPEAKQTLVDRMKLGINSFLSDRSSEYGAQMDALQKLPTNIPSSQGTQTVIDSFQKGLEKFGGSVGEDGQLSFVDSPLTATDKTNLETAWNTINGWQNSSVKGLDGLRQSIGNLMTDFKIAGNPRANIVLGGVSDELKGFLDKNVPGYSKVLSDYGDKTDLAREVVSELGLNSSKPSVQLTNILKLFQKDPSVKQKVVSVLGEGDADKFLNDLSGAVLSEWLPMSKVGNYFRGLAGAGATGSAAISGAGLLKILGGLGIGAASISPRAIGELTTLLSKGSKSGLGNAVQRGISAVGAQIQ